MPEDVTRVIERLLEAFDGDGFTGGVNKRQLDGAFVAHCVNCLNYSDQKHDEDCVRGQANDGGSERVSIGSLP